MGRGGGGGEDRISWILRKVLDFGGDMWLCSLAAGARQSLAANLLGAARSALCLTFAGSPASWDGWCERHSDGATPVSASPHWLLRYGSASIASATIGCGAIRAAGAADRRGRRSAIR